MQELSNRGINTEIQEQKINELLHYEIYRKRWIVAKGVPAVKGKDGWYEFMFDKDFKEMKPKIREDGSVDYSPNIQIVNKGDKVMTWIFNNTCHFLHIFDISETLIVTQVMIALETIYLGYIQICDLFADKRTNGKEGGGFFWWIPSVGFILLSPLLLLEVLKYITNYTLKYDDNTILPTIGGVIYIMSLAIHSGLKLASENFMVTEASRAKSNFLANTSHDIRTPLNAILGFNDLILRDSEEEKTKEICGKRHRNRYPGRGQRPFV